MKAAAKKEFVDINHNPLTNVIIVKTYACRSNFKIRLSPKSYL